MDWIEVLKWIGLVLAAGFVGYFGRYLAKWIIERMRGDKTSVAPSTDPPPDPEVRLEETKAKLEKKRVKTEAKKAKKAGKK